jgi:hypothetical protein
MTSSPSSQRRLRGYCGGMAIVARRIQGGKTLAVAVLGADIGVATAGFINMAPGCEAA